MIRYIEKPNKPINIIDYNCCGGVYSKLLKMFTDTKWRNNLIFFINVEDTFPNKEFLSRINRTHKLIFYTVHGINYDTFLNFLTEISKTIDKNNIFVMIGYENQVKKLQKRLHNNGVYNINLIANMTWLKWTYNKSQLSDTKIAYPSKKFSIFSRRYEEWRKLIYLDMLSKNLLDDTHYTFSNLHPDLPNLIANVEQMSDNLPDYLLPHSNKIVDWLSKVPYSIEYQNPVSVPVYDLIQDSHINIVLETHIHKSANNVILTEKTYKPIVMKRPFIIYGIPHVLRMLREQGFKTFKGIIDENYDLIEDAVERRLVIVQELERINNMNPDEFRVAMNECNKICEHNYNIMLEHYNKGLPESFLNLNIFGNK